jgi:MSHA pilin protein MshC
VAVPEASAAKRARGFTLVELIATMTIVGIVAALAGPRFFDSSVFAAAGFAADTKSALRYAHKLAQTSGCSIHVALNAQGYRVSRWHTDDCNARTGDLVRVARAGGGLLEARPPDAVALRAGVAFFFDPIGRPRASESGAELAQDLVFSVGENSIMVHARSGLIE